MDRLRFSLWKTPLGWIGMAANARGLVTLTVPRRSRRAALGDLNLEEGATRGDNRHLRAARAELARYFDGDPGANLLRLELDPQRGTEFEKQVWRLVRAIPRGQVRTYAEIARAAGRPGAARAVGRCNARNPWAIVVPCHRLIGSNGQLTGYSGGLAMKRRLLELEGIDVRALAAERQRGRRPHADRD